jgi:cell division protein FtsI (penicillin-binding protein 3)
MAGKTGTAQVDYGKDGGSGQYYASSFVGYFPADNLSFLV